MALFGAPVAHEDHAVRACYAALDLQRAMRRLTDDLRRSHGVTVEVRAGLNSGEVVVRAISSALHMDYTAVGQTTHLAARMEQLASPGTTLLTADTLRLAEGYIEVKPLGPMPIKGLPAPVEAYELVGAGPRRSRLSATATRDLTRFVGRAGELEQLREALDRSASGHGQVVAIVGEPGVGKSRLVLGGYPLPPDPRLADIRGRLGLIRQGHAVPPGGRRALDLAHRQKERGNEAWVLHLLGMIAAHTHATDLESAQKYYRRALAPANELGMRPLVAHCHLGLGKLYARTGKREQAQEHLTTATTMYHEMA
jgi:hypothetical protein